MPDPNFFKSTGEFTLSEIAGLTGAELSEPSAGDFKIQDVAPLDEAQNSDLSFLDNIKYKDQFEKTLAGACFVKPEFQNVAPSNTRLLLTPFPYKAYALAAQKLYPDIKPEAHVAETAVIAGSAKIGKSCVIEGNVVIQDDAVIGDYSWLEPGCVIGANVQIGSGCRIGANAVVSHALIGDHVRLYPGVAVGQDGFGFAIDPSGHVKVPQLGRVIIEDGVQIGANTTIDRGAGPDTVIGQGTWIDNLVQIGHNVKIGKGCIIVAQCGISGSTVLDDFAVLGGQVGVAGHLHIGKGARVAAQSGIMRDIPPGEEQMGYPALPMRQFMRQIATLNRLVKKEKSS